ncbi:MAG: BON domain-containing protein [Acidobacteria bacterium]|nr:BON domain-containing protein [Acidobacteriota bacterium]
MKFVLAAALVVLGLGLAACDAPQTVDDAGITTKIKTKMAADSRTSALKVSVDTVNGVVTLTGAVPAQSEKTAADEIAKMTDGVKSVVNNITINPATTSVSNIGEKTEAAAKEAAEDMSDAGVLAKIKTKFVAEGIIGTNVDVVNGVATLNGTVEDASEKTRAEQIAKATSGVKNVKNMLKIEKKK